MNLRLWKSVVKLGFCLSAAFILFELIFIAWVWPDWDAWRRGDVPESALIKHYQSQREEDPKLPKLRWTSVRKPFPQRVKKAFLVAEDSRFYEHGGIDYQAIRDAMAYNLQRGKILLGASTISQQTAKNMFLSLSRSPLRKWHELILTYILEAMLKKDQILHVYLNVAEFGVGLYGLEAAARAYYGVSASQLSQEQAIELAATLPSPKKNNPKSRTRPFQKRVHRISATMRVMDQYVAQQGKRPSANDEAMQQELAKKLEQLRQDMAVEAASEVQQEVLAAEKPSDDELAKRLGEPEDHANAEPAADIGASGEAIEQEEKASSPSTGETQEESSP